MFFFNWIDLLCITLLVLGCYFGFKKGFTFEVFRFAGIITAMFLALHNYRSLAKILDRYCCLPSIIAKIISFLILVILIVIIFKVASVFVQKIIQVTVIKKLDKIGGLILGLLRYLIITSLVLIGCLFIPGDYLNESINERSVLGAYVVRVAPAIYSGLIRIFPAYRHVGINHVLNQAMEK